MPQHLTVHAGREEEEGKAKFFLSAVNFQPRCFSCWRTVFLFFWAEMQVIGWEQNLLLWMWSWENPQGSSKLWFQPRQDFRNMARHLNFSGGFGPPPVSCRKCRIQGKKLLTSHQELTNWVDSLRCSFKQSYSSENECTHASQARQSPPWEMKA